MTTDPDKPDWRRYHDLGLFLSCFRTPHTYQEVAGITHWTQILHWDPDTVLDRFLASGLLAPAGPLPPLAQRLQALHVPELRDLSRERDLPTSRSKDELIAQLLQRDPKGMDRVTLRRVRLTCTAEGARIVDEYLARGIQALPGQGYVPPDQARKVVDWILLAAAAGIIGDAAYDSLKALAETLREKAVSARAARLPFEPEMVHVPAGPFLMGTSGAQVRAMRRRFDWAKKAEFGYEQPSHWVTLSAFDIGRYPVTNAQYAAFVDATGHRAPSHWKRGSFSKDEADHPVEGVVRHDTDAYVLWLREKTGQHYRLPTEAEWEKAARGTDGRLWPWGNETPDERRCNFDRNGITATQVGQYSPAGDSPYGCADMAGNVFEWCHSRYKPYPYESGDGREDGRPTGEPVLRGGGYWEAPDRMRCAYRCIVFRDHVLPQPFGFRVARGPAPW